MPILSTNLDRSKSCRKPKAAIMQTTASRTKTGYFKLATFCPISMTWKDGRTAFETKDAATTAARKPGKYRISRVHSAGRTDLDPFVVS
jgi:hypothetical protein